MTYCAAPGHAPDFVVVVADRTPLSDSSSASSGTHPGTCSLRPPFDTNLLGLTIDTDPEQPGSADPGSDGSDSEGPGPDLVELAHWLFDRARAGEAARLGAYVDAGTPVDLTDPAGNTLLMLAAYHGHAAAVSTLLARGADPNRVNDRGQTPLAGAVFKGYADVVQVLVAAGADPDLGSPSARASATFFERPDLAALLSSAQ
jgi:hypothetical protein